MSDVTISWKFKKTGLDSQIKKAAEDSTFLDWLGQETLTTVNWHVPLRSGTLRESGKIDRVDSADARVYITWDAKTGSADLPEFINKEDSYAHYIYEGVVYGPNRLNKDGLWYSAASEKTSENRPMTYHMMGTQDHWDSVIQRGGVEYQDYRDVIKDKLRSMLNND